MAAKPPSEAMQRALAQIALAKSAVVINKGSITQVLAAGEIVKATSDTFLRLLVGGFLVTFGDGRLSPTLTGQEIADRFMDRNPREFEGETV
jgi:hypothetical protein